MTFNGLSQNGAYWTFSTFPEVLEKAGVSWKIYQDLAGSTFAPDFGDGTSNSFVGNFGDNSVAVLQPVPTSSPGNPLFDNACTGTSILNTIPARGGAAEQTGKPGNETLFDQFRSDVKSITSYRRCPGSSRRPAIQNTPTGPSTTAPGTSRRSSTFSFPIRRCSARLS